MEPDRWQRKYRETVDELDRREREWRAAEELLRRIAGRLSIAARGQDPRLDESLNGLIAALRKPVEDADALEPLLVELTQAVAALDHRAPAAPAAAAAVAAAASVAAPATPPPPTLDLVPALTRLIERLEPASQQRDEVQALKQRLLTLSGDAALAQAAMDLAELIDGEASSLRRERGDADRLLQELSQRLEEISSYLHGERSERDSAAADGRALDQALISETEQLYDNVRQASDLGALQLQVHRRISRIGEHLREHRSREDARLADYRARAEKLSGRVEELENKTHVLTRSLQKTERRAFTDALTGVANRQAYIDRMATELKQWRRDKKPRSLATFDVDHFKSINDQYGHLAGDKVLQVLAQHLARRVRENDFIARYGGEEFVLLMDNLSASQALGVSEKLRQSVEKLGFHFRRQPVSVTISCGLTSLRDGDTAESLFERADQALYQAKKNGRNQCVAG